MKLKKAERKQADGLAEDHHRIRIYRSKRGRGGGILLSRDAMHSPGVREFFWIRFPNTRSARNRRRRGLLVWK